MPARAVTAEDISNWMTPAQAVVLVRSVVENEYIARNAILERLRGAMVRAIADTSIFEGDKTHLLRNPIGAEDWLKVRSSDDSFWITGALNYEVLLQSKHVVLRHFDVRFHPDDIRGIVPPSTERPTETSEQADTISKGPPVSDALLQGWLELYQLAYGETPRDTLEMAWTSARGMFPDKSVTRDRIRKLLAGRKPGPKTTR